MSELLHLAHTFQVRAMAQEERSLDVVASSEAIDSYGEIVAQDWDLRRYLANPVVLWGHNSYGMPIGKASDVRVETDANGRSQLLAKLTFVDAKANPVAEQVWQGIVQGSIRAVSVGFRAKNVSVKPVGQDKEVLVLSGNELIEISVVPIPANPEALALGKKTFDTIRAIAKRSAPTEPTMSVLLPSLVTLLGLSATASEGDVVAHAKTLTARADDAKKMLEAVGADSVEKALGIIAAGKEAVAAVAEQAKKLEALERGQIIATAKAEKKLTPAQEKALEGKSLDFVKGFIELQTPNAVLSAPTVNEPKVDATGATFKGKTWDQLDAGDKHDLFLLNHDLYVAMKASA